MKRHWPILLLLVCAAAFLVGVLQLFKLRFEAGDSYPEYSSLRADPLGTMALYESLEKVPNITVVRDHAASNQLPDGRSTTYLHIAAPTFTWDSLPKELWKEIDNFLISGGRLAITFYPETGWNFWSAGSIPTVTTNKAAGTNAPGTKNPQARRRADLRRQLQGGKEENEVSVEDHWGIHFQHVTLPQGDNDTYKAVEVVNASSLALPRTLDWHSATVFTNLDKAWQTIYSRRKAPVMIERKFGAGSVVMATDSFFLSNEALRKEPHADLLAWIVGPSRHVVFDEAHLGIVEEGGVAVLIRKYRLHGLALGLLILAGLFIWKNSVSLVPPTAAEKSQNYVAGKDATAGFVNLLRRNIQVKDVLNACFAEWTRTLLQGKHYTIAGVDQAQAVLEEENARVPTRRDPVVSYKRICEVLNRPRSNKVSQK